VFTEDGKVIDCNDQFGRMLGFRGRKEILSKNIRDFINPFDLDRLQRQAELPSPNRMEVRARNEGGDPMVLEASGSKINVNGKLLDAFLLYDITSRKKTEQALEQSMDRFKGLVENSPNGVFIITDGKVRYANFSGLKLLGYTDEDDVFNAPFVDFFKSKSRKYLGDDLDRVRQGEDVSFRELTILDRHKNEIDVGIKMILTVYDNKPSIQITINNLQTERLLIQEKLRAQLAEEINTVLKREIEEHKATQRKLTAAENFTRNIIESSLDMIIAVDKNSMVTEFNRSAQSNFGYRGNDIIGKHVKKLFADDKEYERVLAMLSGRGYYSGEILNKRKSGELFPTFLSASLIRNQDGEILGSMGVSRDITELKHAEQELRNSEERYRDIFDNANDFIISINKEGKIEYANNAFLETIGYSSEALADIHINELCESHKTTKTNTVFKVFSGNNMTTTWLTHKGEKVIAQGSASVRQKNGKPDSIRAIFRNVTGELAQRAKLESLFNSTENILIWTVDKKMRITSFNLNFQKFLMDDFNISIKLGDNLLKKFEPVLNQDLYQGQMEGYDQAFNGRARQFEIPLLNTAGQTVWLQSFLNPVNYADKLEEVSCISYDVTERKQIDRKIRDALKEKEVLLQEVHHRVKNNLQVISSILNLQSGYVKDPKTLDILKESQDRIKSMSYIHETLYQTADFSSIEFPDYINTLSRSLIHSYITDKPVRLETEFDEVYLGIDQAIPCGLIVNELVSNALKYAFKGIKDPVLRITIKEKNGIITLRVKDNGVGLPADFKYQESDSLGIQLVYTLTDQIDGTIEMNNDSGADIIVTFEKPEQKIK
jgi:PAS domain S-box-containing protein